MVEYEVAGKMYRSEKLDAFEQFHVSRKIAPLVPKLVPAFTKFKETGKEGKEGITDIVEAFSPFLEAFAEMDDAKVNSVIRSCAIVTKRAQGTGYSSIWNEQAKAFMFDDIGLDVMLPVIAHVLRDSLGNFITGLLSQAGVAEMTVSAAPNGQPLTTAATGS